MTPEKQNELELALADLNFKIVGSLKESFDKKAEWHRKEAEAFRHVEENGKRFISMIRPIIRRKLGDKYLYYEIRFNNGFAILHDTEEVRPYIEIELFSRKFKCVSTFWPRTVQHIINQAEALRRAVDAFHNT